MTPAVVVDVGNTRIKWGLCDADGVRAVCALPQDEPESWSRQREEWPIACGLWVVAGVHPQRRDHFIAWLLRRGQRVHLFDDPKELPLRIQVDRPDHVGVDRLLDAVAANSRRKTRSPAIVIDAGSAVTVDLIDASGAFLGGAILPGMRLMAKALHDYTALLPLIPLPEKPPALPGRSTSAAMEAGIFWAVAGGIQVLIGRSVAALGSAPNIFLTGGDGPLLHTVLPEAQLWPEMTLEGIRLSAETLP